jgi:hypothetical protein
MLLHEPTQDLPRVQLLGGQALLRRLRPLLLRLLGLEVLPDLLPFLRDLLLELTEVVVDLFEAGIRDVLLLRIEAEAGITRR